MAETQKSTANACRKSFRSPRFVRVPCHQISRELSSEMDRASVVTITLMLLGIMVFRHDYMSSSQTPRIILDLLRKKQGVLFGSRGHTRSEEFKSEALY